MVRKKKKSLFNKRYLAIAAAAVLLLVVGLVALWPDNKTSPAAYSGDNNLTKTATSGEVNLNPATSQDQQNSDSHKDADVAQDKAAASSSQSSGVTPIISYAGVDGVYAYVQGIFEDGGSCTATFSKGAQTFTKSTTGFKDATHTTCPPFDGLSFPSSGDWAVKVSYNSSKYQGESAVSYIKVP